MVCVEVCCCKCALSCGNDLGNRVKQVAFQWCEKRGVTSEECGCRVRALNLDGVFITKGQTEENLGTLSIKVSLHADG